MAWGSRELASFVALASGTVAAIAACSPVLGLGDFGYAPGGDDGGDSGAPDTSPVDSGHADVVHDAGAGGDVTVLYQGTFGLMCAPWMTTDTTATAVDPDGGPPSCKVCGASPGGNVQYGYDFQVPMSGTFEFTTLVAAVPATDEGGTIQLYATMALNFADAAPMFPHSNPTATAAFASAGVAQVAEGVTGVGMEVGGAPGGTPEGQCFLFAEPELLYMPGQ